MRRFLLLLIIPPILFKGAACAQSSSNSWINYKQTYYKFKLLNDSVIYKIPYSTLNAAGLSGVPGSEFQLFKNGKQVPIYVTTSGLLSPSDYIEFSGTRNDGWVDSGLYMNGGQTNKELSCFTDSSSYYLTYSAEKNLHYIFTNAPTGSVDTIQYCLYTGQIILGQRNYYFYYEGYPACATCNPPLWLPEWDNGEGYLDNNVVAQYQGNANSINYSFNTPYVYPNGPPAVAWGQFWGYNFGSHYAQLGINDTIFDYIPVFYNVTGQTFYFTFPAKDAQSSNGITNLYFTCQGAGSPSAYDEDVMANAELQYPRRLNAGNASVIHFKVPGVSIANQFLNLSNYNSKNTTPLIFDMTNLIVMPGTVSNTSVYFTLPPTPAKYRNVIITSQAPGDIATINSLEKINFVDYTNPANEGDFIIISNPVLFNDGNGNNYVQEYADFKNSCGYHAIVVDINQLYDQFAYGVQRHPLSIRNFALYARQHWTLKPKYLFLIGKGAQWESYIYDPTTGNYEDFNDDPANYLSLCLVPTYGTPGADELFTATNYDPTPALATGRLSVTTPSEVAAYLQKAKDFVSQQTITPQLQTIANKLWMKNILHFAGGTDQADQDEFQTFLNNYKNIAQSTLYGAKVYSFYKTSTNPIQEATSNQITSLINNGVSLMTFFGHSSTDSWDFNVDAPSNYNNYKKYPMILSNGCYLGNIFLVESDPQLSETWINIPNKGAIAFVASSYLSLDYSTNDYSAAFYTKLCNLSYHNGIGDAIKQDIQYNVDTLYQAYTYPGNMYNAKLAVEQMDLNGDPSLSLNTHPKPDYDLETSTVNFSPAVITAADDTFDLLVYPTNLGMAVNDSIYISVTRTFPNGSQLTLYDKKIKAPYNQDSVPVRFKVYTDSTIGYGLNKFTVTLDPRNQVDEITKINNSVSVEIYINGDDLLPAYPYNYSIVDAQNIMSNKGLVLKACTANPFAALHKYDIQIDTTALFNSPLMQAYSTTQTGGVIKWKPNITLHDSTVYYWRTAYDTLYTGQYNWHTYSFIYLPKSSPGWNQSHYYQYLNDNYGDIFDSTNRKFYFVKNNKYIFAQTGVTYLGNGPITDPFDIKYNINGFPYLVDDVAYGPNGLTTTFMLAVFDDTTGLPWQNPPDGNGYGKYGSLNEQNYALNGFFFDSYGIKNQDTIANFINNVVPKGDYVLGFTVDHAYISSFGPVLLNALGALGCKKIDTATFDRPYIFFGRKGQGNNYKAQEILADTALETISANFTLPGSWYTGFVQSPQIGPALQWTSFHWKHHPLGKPTDSTNVNIYGINNAGTQTLLYKAFRGTDLSLSFINPKIYPQIVVQENTTDTTNKTPAQLNYWRVNYQPMPDAALNPTAYLSIQHVPTSQFAGDSLQQGQPFAVGVDVDNITDYGMDSLWMKYTVSTTSGGIMPYYTKNRPLGANDSLHLNFNYGTNGSTPIGIDNLLMEVNPYTNHHQPEEYHFNNLGNLPFTVKKNTINPALDVTFDGIHILNNDIVSAKPNILITLRDQNKYLPLTDTNFISVYIETPSSPNTPMRINYRNNAPVLLFNNSPVAQNLTSSNNICSATYTPDFTVDGTYTLIVEAHDSSGNVAGTNAYEVSFQIINKEMISSVLNYPNPFTTSTRFVFTLTGSQVPSFFKIEIMTITGKIVKEITQNEIGPLHIGTNISQYAWNGTDQYGNQLGNGLYLYHVVASVDGQSLAHYDSGADQFIKSGFGKMYLLK